MKRRQFFKTCGMAATAACVPALLEPEFAGYFSGPPIMFTSALTLGKHNFTVDVKFIMEHWSEEVLKAYENNRAFRELKHGAHCPTRTFVREAGNGKPKTIVSLCPGEDT